MNESDEELDFDELLKEAEALQIAQIGRASTSDDRLERAVAAALLTPWQERPWEIRADPRVGRHLVARRALRPGELVFRETPLAVGEASGHGDSTRSASAQSRRASTQSLTSMCTVAIELLLLPANSAATLLQEPSLPPDARHLTRSLDLQSAKVLSAIGTQEYYRADGSSLDACTADEVRWALGVATVNAHDAMAPDRAVLGLLASMMEHSCEPCCRIRIASVEEDSVINLVTTRAVQAGEPLSISYVPTDRSLTERRNQLLYQHGFLCRCKRCMVDETSSDVLTASGFTDLQNGRDTTPRT